MSHLTYLGLLVACLAATVPLDVVYRTHVLARPLALVQAIAPVFLVFTVWDAYAIDRGQWTYNGRYVTGIRLPGHLPVEEVLFFVVIPFASILTFEAVRRVSPANRPASVPAAGR